MEKSNYQYKNYLNLSKNESELLESVNSFLVFSVSIIKKITSWKLTKVNNTLTSLKKKNIIVYPKKDNYIVRNKISENIFVISNLLVSPSYISFWTALSFYGFTEQQVIAVQLVSTRQHHKLKMEQFNIETTTFSKERFYGYKTINNFCIAEKEKLIIDCLFMPEKSGGINEIKKCLLNMWREINQETLFEYLKRFNNNSLFARLGFLLEELKLKNIFEKKFLKNLPSSYVKLNPKRKNLKKISQKWMVNINDQ